MPRTSEFRSTLRSAAWGAVVGAALGIAFLALGLAAFGLTVAFSDRSADPIRAHDLVQMAAYVSGFALAGAVVGAVRPLERGRAAVYGAMAMGGAIVMNIIAISDEGFAGMDRLDWFAMSAIGALFGLAGARGFLSGARD